MPLATRFFKDLQSEARNLSMAEAVLQRIPPTIIRRITRRQRVFGIPLNCSMRD
jgi:hypothetical protein